MTKLLDQGGATYLINKFNSSGLQEYQKNKIHPLDKFLRKATNYTTLDTIGSNANTLYYNSNVWGQADGKKYIGIPSSVRGRFHLLTFNSGNSGNALQNIFQILICLDPPKGLFFRQSWDRWESWYQVPITEVTDVIK